MSTPDATLAAPVAVLYDVHGNLPALEAVLAAADAAGARTIVVGGDVVPGPMPRETIARLRALGDRALFLRGNCDRLVVDALDGQPLTGLPPAVREIFAWTAGQLGPEEWNFLAGFPATLAAWVPGVGEVLFCHATPRSDEEIVTTRTPADRVRPMLAGVTQRVVICGHTHVPADWAVDGVRLVNAGSVGMPCGAPGAYWLLLGPGIQSMRTPYDAERAAEAVRGTAYPDAAGFAERYVVRPVPVDDALDRLESPPSGAARG